MFLVPLPSFHRFARQGAFHDSALRSPALDVAESDADYTVSLDLPGVAKDDVKVAIDGRRVSVSAQSKTDTTAPREGERLIYRERAVASFERSFALPEEIDQEASLAKLDNGVLSLTLAKKRVAPARTITVN